ncbi:MAG: Ig-like domain-containing protein, partial [Verrucomicrobiota bacterium]
SFRYDAVALAVTSTVPTTGTVQQIPFTSIFLDFSEPYDTSSVSVADLQLSQGNVVGVNLIDADTIEFVLDGINAETLLTVDLPAGALTDLFGNPNLIFNGAFELDFGVTPLPVNLSPVPPLGSLVYDPPFPGSLFSPADVDTFTLALDATQTLSVVIEPGATLQPQIDLVSPSGATQTMAVAGGVGQTAWIQSSFLGPAGTWTVQVSSAAGSTGSYTAEFVLNAAVEEETHGAGSNDSPAMAQNIDGAFIPVGPAGGLRGAVLGQAQFPGLQPPTVFYTENFDLGLGGYVISNDFGTGNGLWHLSTGRSADGQSSHSPPANLYYGQSEDEFGNGTYDTGLANGGAVISPTIVLPLAGRVTLNFNTLIQTEGNPTWDAFSVAIDDGSGFNTILSTTDGSPMALRAVAHGRHGGSRGIRGGAKQWTWPPQY